ncbi:MAG: cupin domain-containing protein [Candidatus Omnitrophota bacterium]
MKKIERDNIYAKIPSIKKDEIFETLLSNRKLKIERIISHGQVMKKGVWLNEAHDEWVMVLKGAGTLLFRKGNQLVKMKKGDYLLIPANTQHRVVRTAPGRPTIWLAIQYPGTRR